MRRHGFSEAEVQASAFDGLAGSAGGCARCYGKGLVGESAPGRVPGDVMVWADSTGWLAIEDDLGGKWKVEPHEPSADTAVFFEAERQRAHKAVDARFDAMRDVLERRAMLPDQLLVPIKPDRLLILEEQEAKHENAVREQQAAQAKAKAETRCGKAVQLLEAMFAKQPELAAKDAIAQAEAAGITRDAMFRARRELSVEVRKNGRAGWLWRLPSTVQSIKSSDCQIAPRGKAAVKQTGA